MVCIKSIVWEESRVRVRVSTCIFLGEYSVFMCSDCTKLDASCAMASVNVCTRVGNSSVCTV